MTTLTFSLICFLAASLGAVAVLSLLLNHKQQTRWMRAFGEQHGITPQSMEDKPIPKEVVKPEKKRKKLLSIPIPGADWLREVNNK